LRRIDPAVRCVAIESHADLVRHAEALA
jgi:hypothetical protein